MLRKTELKFKLPTEKQLKERDRAVMKWLKYVFSVSEWLSQSLKLNTIENLDKNLKYLQMFTLKSD